MMIPCNATLDNSVLLVIDVINSCAHTMYEDQERGIHYNKIRQMIPSLVSFIASFRQLGGRVILTTTVPWQEQYLPDNINELYRENQEARYWSGDTGGHAERLYGIPADGMMVFAKNGHDAFTSENLVCTLEEMRVRYIIIYWPSFRSSRDVRLGRAAKGERCWIDWKTMPPVCFNSSTS
jgi:hypothetical protein